MRRQCSFQAKRLTLVDPEAVLFVDHDEAEVEETHGIPEKCVGADDDARPTGHGSEQRLLSLGRAELAGEQSRSKTS